MCVCVYVCGVSRVGGAQITLTITPSLIVPHSNQSNASPIPTRQVMSDCARPEQKAKHPNPQPFTSLPLRHARR